MKQKNTVLRFMEAQLEETYGWGQTQRILEQAEALFASLCRKYAADPKAVRRHTEGLIYPTVALYRTMEELGIPKAEALSFLDRTHSLRAEPKAKSIRSALKIPGLCQAMPAIYHWMTVHNFGTDAGFHAEFYDVGKHRCKFDMTKCIYCETCRKLDCPELTQCFCHTDDVTSGRMHPRILWNRTKTMGEGGDVCDFDIIVLQKGESPDAYQPPESCD